MSKKSSINTQQPPKHDIYIYLEGTGKNIKINVSARATFQQILDLVLMQIKEDGKYDLDSYLHQKKLPFSNSNLVWTFLRNNTHLLPITTSLYELIPPVRENEIFYCCLRAEDSIINEDVIETITSYPNSQRAEFEEDNLEEISESEDDIIRTLED